MDRWTGWVLRHRLLVVLLWLGVAVSGAVTAPRTVDRLSLEFALPGQPAYEANQEITRLTGGGGADDPLLLVARGTDAPAVAARLASRAARSVPGTRVVSADDPGADSLTTRDGRTSVVVVVPPVPAEAPAYAAAQRRLEQLAARASGDGTSVRLTGFVVLAENGGGGGRSVLVEVLLGGIGALVVLALVFGSLLAGLPLLVAAVSILGTFLALLGLTYLTDVSFVVQFLVALIGLGVAIDYSLLIVTRWREERAAGRNDDEAVRVALRTAGHSVAFSGVTVAVSLAALVLVPLPFLRSIGLGGLLIPLFSVATSLSLVPAVLSRAGSALTWPRRRAQARASRFWARTARAVLQHRWWAVVGASVVLLALAAPVLSLRLGSPQLSGVASTGPASRAATEAVRSGLPLGVLRPTEVLVPDQRVEDLAQRLRRVDGVAGVAVPEGRGWRRDGEQLLQVWPRADAATEAGRATLAEVRGTVGVDGVVGGSPAEDADFVTAVYDHVGWVVLAVVVVTFLLLARALRSLWLPVKALVLNVVSIAAAYGVTVLVWQHGLGSELLFGQQASGVVTTWVPIAAFAFLFGLSMDYEVFILSRVREAWDEVHDTDRAVVEGISRTGRLVTSAALILFLAFVALSTVPTVEVKILATTLALGIAIDALVVRSVLAPALVGVLGPANWTLPGWLARLLRVRPGEPTRT